MILFSANRLHISKNNKKTSFLLSEGTSNKPGSTSIIVLRTKNKGFNNEKFSQVLLFKYPVSTIGFGFFCCKSFDGGRICNVFDSI